MRNRVLFYSYHLAVFGGLAILLALTGCSKSDAQLKASVVKLINEHGECSGEQVRAYSGKEYILTAAHCAALADASHSIHVETEDGRSLDRRIIAEDPDSDLLLLEGVPNLPSIRVAYQLPKTLRTFTHGNNLDTYKTSGEVIQVSEVTIPISIIDSPEALAACDISLPKYKVMEVPIFGPLTATLCVMTTDDTVTNAMIVPGSSGGMAVNDAGELVGVVSAGDGHFGFLVSLPDIQAFLANY